MTNFVLRTFSSLILIPFFIYIIYINNFLFKVLLILMLILSVYELRFLFKKKKQLIFILILLLFFAFCFYHLRGNQISNFYYLMWLIILVWLSDTGGFLFGKIFKGPRFTKISPSKTYSGLIGSILFSQLAFFVIFFYQPNVFFSFKFFIVQLFLCLISIFGDLYFSYIKRSNNIKDFSKIIPGHGGILDRIDGLIFVIVFSYLLKLLNVY